MRTNLICLTNHLGAFVDEQANSGRHQNASEVVREELQRYKDDILVERATLAAIEKVAQDGIAAIDRGDFALVGGRDGSRALLNRLAERAARRTAADVPRRG